MDLSEEDVLDQRTLKDVKDYFPGSQNISLMRLIWEILYIYERTVKNMQV